MKLKLNQILAGVLVLQILLSALVLWPRSAEVVQESVFADLDPASVTGIMLEDDSGAEVQLARSNGQWVLPALDNYPALETEINALLTGLVSISIGDTVTSSTTSQRALQVAENNFLRKVTLSTDSGDEYVIYMGSSPNYGATHFRIGGEQDTHLASDLDVSDYNARVSDWIDAVYLRVNQEDLTSIQLQNAQGTLTFSKDAAGAWQLDGLLPGEVQNDAELNNLLSRSSAITMTSPTGLSEDPAWAFDEPLAVLTFTTTDGTVTLRVGAQDPDDLSYVIKSSESDYYARVREYSVDSLVTFTRESFIEQPTATPTLDPAMLPQATTTPEVQGEGATPTP
ncbi:MAG: DUF4340 domain-containing protein [Anaerolineales bacterium]|nr:DUF4340 domain-containing protein [Anaerolineales bacterium]